MLNGAASLGPTDVAYRGHCFNTGQHFPSVMYCPSVKQKKTSNLDDLGSINQGAFEVEIT